MIESGTVARNKMKVWITRYKEEEEEKRKRKKLELGEVQGEKPLFFLSLHSFFWMWQHNATYRCDSAF